VTFAVAAPPRATALRGNTVYTRTMKVWSSCLTLVYPKDVGGEHERISVLAPVGSALLGLSVGDEIEWPRPGGGRSIVRVTDVVYQPERSGDLHR
jgi:regulator of nucleoside diphosphate kinase